MMAFDANKNTPEIELRFDLILSVPRGKSVTSGDSCGTNGRKSANIEVKHQKSAKIGAILNA